MRPRPSAVLPWVLAGLVVVLAVAWARHRMDAAAFFDDAPTFLSAPRVALSGQSPYAREALTTYFAAWLGEPRQAFPFIYPPPFLLFCSWTLGFDRFESAQTAWFAVNVVAAFALAWRLSAWSGIPGWAAVAGVCAMHATPANWQVGNVNVALALVLLEAVMRMSGTWLAVGVMLKISPLLALASFVVQRRGRSLVAFAATAAALVVATALLFPVSIFPTFFVDVLPALQDGSYGMAMPPLVIQRNHGLSRLLVHLGSDPTLATLSPAANALRTVLAAAMALGVAVSSRRETPGTAGMLRAAGGYGVVMIVCAPIGWDHHLVVALAAVAYSWTVAARARSRRGMAAVVAAYVLLALPEDWWQPVTYVLPELAGPLGSLKLAVLLALYAVCVRPPVRT